MGIVGRLGVSLVIMERRKRGFWVFREVFLEFVFGFRGRNYKLRVCV